MSLLCGHSVSGTGKGYPTSTPTWRYVKGSEADFKTYSERVLVIRQRQDNGFKFGTDGTPQYTDWLSDIIAQRERVTSVNDDRLARDMGVDVVNHPSHYTQGDIECIDAIKAATVGKTGIEAVCVANVVKYLWRYEEKNGVEDVKKARWYLERLISELESK